MEFLCDVFFVSFHFKTTRFYCQSFEAIKKFWGGENNVFFSGLLKDLYCNLSDGLCRVQKLDQKAKLALEGVVSALSRAVLSHHLDIIKSMLIIGCPFAVDNIEWIIWND